MTEGKIDAMSWRLNSNDGSPKEGHYIEERKIEVKFTVIRDFETSMEKNPNGHALLRSGKTESVENDHIKCEYHIRTSIHTVPVP